MQAGSYLRREDSPERVRGLRVLRPPCGRAVGDHRHRRDVCPGRLRQLLVHRDPDRHPVSSLVPACRRRGAAWTPAGCSPAAPGELRERCHRRRWLGGLSRPCRCACPIRASSCWSARPAPASRTGRAEWFAPDQVVSSDRLRAVVGAGERDQRASKDAFEVLDLIVDKRLRARPDDRRSTPPGSTPSAARPGWRWPRATASRPTRSWSTRRRRSSASATARARRRCRPRSSRPAARRRGGRRARSPRGLRRRARRRPVDARAARVPRRPGRRRPPARGSDARSTSACRSRASTSPATPQRPAATLAEVARAAEEAGFTSLWVMDHFLQIPQVGREWEDMLESYTTLGYLAGVTERIRLGTLVTGITYRNLAHLAKIVATLDVLSGGRALCGLGAAWFEREHRLYGWDFPPLRERYARLEDALELLPLMWGKGSPRVRGPHAHRARGRVLPAAAAGARSRSSSAARASGGRCGSSPATPTPATCSATPRRRARTRSPSCTSTARPRAATRPTITVTHLAAGARDRGGRAARRARARRPPRSTSAATASWPRPASRPRSSASATPTAPTRSPLRARSSRPSPAAHDRLFILSGSLLLPGRLRVLVGGLGGVLHKVPGGLALGPP